MFAQFWYSEVNFVIIVIIVAFNFVHLIHFHLFGNHDLIQFSS